MTGGERGRPTEAGRPSLQQTGVQAELEAPVPHAADIRRDEVPEIRGRVHGNVEDQVGGLLGVPIERAAVTLVREPEVDAGVVRARRLPMDSLVHGAGTDRGDEVVAEPLFCNDAAATMIYTLSLLDARPP